MIPPPLVTLAPFTPAPSESERELRVLLENWVVDPQAPSSNGAPLLPAPDDPTGRTSTPCALTLSHCRSQRLFAPVLLTGEEWVPSQGTWLLGQRERVCYASSLPDLCGFEQLHLFLSLRGTQSPLWLLQAMAP